MKRPARRTVLGAICLSVAVASSMALTRKLYAPFPSDQTPEGAYQRIAKNVADDDIAAIFAYLETDAQWASFTIRDLRAKALARIDASYPADQRGPLEAAYGDEARTKDGPDLFAYLARHRGWVTRLRRDLSGIANVQIEGERATVVTTRGTRYAFRRRENGIWGLTLFTAELMAESERAARDLTGVQAAADDYERGAKR